MDWLKQYLSEQVLFNNPALMQEYLEEQRSKKMSAQTPYVMGSPEQGTKEAFDYPMMEGEEPIQGLWETSPDYQPASAGGLWDNSLTPQDRMMRMTKRAGMSGVPAYQDLAISNLEDMSGSQSGANQPMTVKEWNYYNQLSPEDQQRYIDMKRANYGVVDINEVPTRVPNYVVPRGGAGMQPLSTLDQVTQAAQELASAKQEGASKVLSEWKRIDSLKESKGARKSGIEKATYFLDLLKKGEMSSGGMRRVLSVIPFTFTRQGQLDEEFNAFAETAARAALKEAGEVRPTDADVTGMKRAMFGIGRDEQVNIRLLNQFIKSLEGSNYEAYHLGVGEEYIENRMNEHYAISEDDIKTTMQEEGLTRKEVYKELWKEYNKQFEQE